MQVNGSMRQKDSRINEQGKAERQMRKWKEEPRHKLVKVKGRR